VKVYLVTQRDWNTSGYKVLAIYTSETKAQEAVEVLDAAGAFGEITYIEKEVKE
jgi:hypothetical protein